MRGMLPTLLISLLLVLPAIAGAQVYKWKDAKGVVHYSDSPPPNGVKFKTLHIRAQSDQPPPSNDHGDKGNQADGNSGAQEAGNGNGRSAQLKRFCAQLQSNITLLKSNQNLQRMDSKGKATPIDAKVRAQQLKQQQLRYNAYCTK